MSASNNWCAHPIRHKDDTTIGRRPSHPEGHYPISAQLARNMQAQYRRSIGMSKVVLREGDCLCEVCYHGERARFDKLYPGQAESMECGDEDCQTQQNDSNVTKNSSDDGMEEESDERLSEDSDDSASTSKAEQQISKETLNGVFRLLGVSPIIDM